MEQRDLLKDQIEQLGRVLGKILADFLGLKSEGNVEQGIQISNERLQGELDIDIQKLISLNKADLTAYLINRRLTGLHLETLAQYLHEIGKTHNSQEESQLYLTKAIELLDIADEISKTFSFERMNTKNEIKKALNHDV